MLKNRKFEFGVVRMKAEGMKRGRQRSLQRAISPTDSLDSVELLGGEGRRCLLRRKCSARLLTVLSFPLRKDVEEVCPPGSPCSRDCAEPQPRILTSFPPLAAAMSSRRPTGAPYSSSPCLLRKSVCLRFPYRFGNSASRISQG